MAYTVGTLNPSNVPSTLEIGKSVKLNGAQLSNQTGTLDFIAPCTPPSGPINAMFQAVGSLTGLASKLQVSLDGGTTFNDYIASFLAAALAVYVTSGALGNTSSGTAVTPMIPGAIYRINISALTGTADIYATCQ